MLFLLARKCDAWQSRQPWGRDRRPATEAADAQGESEERPARGYGWGKGASHTGAPALSLWAHDYLSGPRCPSVKCSGADMSWGCWEASPSV